MNTNRRVFLFVVYSVGLFLLVSIADFFFNPKWQQFRKVNLIADIVQSEGPSKDNTDLAPVPPVQMPVVSKPSENFNIYRQARLITNFSADTSQSSLPVLSRKLQLLRSGHPVKIRIAYFGDSMIEGDLLTQTLRELLQKSFGGNGVGFVPITSQVSQFRQTVKASYSDTWEEENFREGSTGRLYLSGHTFHSSNAWVQLIDQTIRDSVIIEKSLICGQNAGTVKLLVNRQSVSITPADLINRVVLANDFSRSLHLSIANDLLPVYGISFESSSGIILDNFSFRGITGIEFARTDSVFLASIAQHNPYDLIIFQYGVNLLFRPKDKDFSWYAKAMLPVIRKVKQCFANSEFMLISTADRAFRYDGEYKSAIGIDSLIKTQALLAYVTGSSFYNQYASMGGTNSIVDWANRKPSLANQDYVHPNHRGAEVLAQYLYEAIIREYDEYVLANP